MEDEFQVAYQRTHDKKDIEYAFFGIFDGHGGKEAAHFAKDNLMDNIVSLKAFWSDNDEDVLTAIKEGFLQTHLAMWKVLGESDCLWCQRRFRLGIAVIIKNNWWSILRAGSMETDDVLLCCHNF